MLFRKNIVIHIDNEERDDKNQTLNFIQQDILCFEWGFVGS